MAGRFYRIFVASPSDVRTERAIAQRIIRRLSREFAHHCELVPVLWEQEPLLASRHFQDAGNIPSAGATDICVVILWSRLGFTLPAERFRGAITGREVTGTEWEFEDALKNCRERGLPDLLVYHKTAEVLASLSDEPALDELRRQRRLVADFFERWFTYGGGEAFSAASHPFAGAADFEGLLEGHLRALLLRRLQADLGSATEAGAITWSGPPWAALAPFGVAQAPIFFGRGRARNELREALARRIDAGCAFVLVIGASGAGKSSLVQAGLLPDLMLPGMLGDVGLVRYGIVRPSDAGGDTLRALAEGILSPTALPELEGLEYRAETLTAQLRKTPDQIAFAVRQGLGRSAVGSLTERGQARLVLVVDQLEELFTSPQITDAERAVFVAALDLLARSGLVWVIATLRADFYGRLDRLPQLAELAQSGAYLLLPPNLAELAEIVGKPARAAGIGFEVDPATGERLDDVILAAAARDPGALPLLSFALDALWRQKRDGRELSFAAYAALGALDGAIANHAERVVSALPEAALVVLPSLLLGLVSTRDGGQVVSARASRRADLPKGEQADLVLERLVSSRLLIADETAHGTSIRLAHEALLRRWPRLTALIADSSELLAMMARLREDFARWQEGNGQPDLLLPEGRRLSEGIVLLERHDSELDEELASFIAASVRLATAARRRRRHLVTGAFATLSVLTLAACLGAWFGLSGQVAAETSRNALQQQLQLAEQRRSQVLALALRDEPDPEVTEAVALSVLPQGPNAAAQSETHLLDRLVLAANAKQQRMVLSGHGSKSIDAAYSPDGRRIVTASFDKKLRVWDAATGVLLLTIAGHTDAVESASFSHDGTRLVSGSDDRTVRVWDAATGAAQLTLRGHTDGVTSAMFSPDGRQIVSASLDKTARLWDARTGALLRVLVGHQAGVSFASFSPGGDEVVTASLDKTAKIWNAQTGALVRTLTGHENYVETAVFSPDGKRILTACNDKTARLWDAQSGATLLVLTGYANGVVFGVFSPDGRRIATSSIDKTVRISDATTGAVLETLIGHGGLVSSVDFSPDGLRLATASLDETARIWDVSASAGARALSGHADYITQASFSPDGSRLLTSSHDKTARVWDVASGASLATMVGHEGGVLDAGFSPDGRRVVTGSLDGSVRLWNAADGSQIKLLVAAGAVPETVSFSPDGQKVLFGGLDLTAHVMDAGGAAGLVTLSGHTNWVRSARFSPDQLLIATASMDGTVRLWDAATGAPKRVIRPGNGDVRKVQFSADGRRLLIASADGTAAVFDAASGAPLLTLAGHKAALHAAAYSPDGKLILTASEDETARVWDAQSGAVLAILPVHGGLIRDAAFSPDGRRIVIVSDDRKIRILDVPNYLGAADLAFIRATSSRALDASLRAQFALPVSPGVADASRSAACTAPAAELAASNNGFCHQRLAETDETGAMPDFAQAFFEHAVAARLLEAQGQAAAQDERYRREALAWQLPRAQAGRLMVAAERWQAAPQK